ncbi:MAG: RDD family protein, partial [Candidatus Hodarchaeota archaeon]
FQILRQHPQILVIPFVIIIIKLVLNIILIPSHDLSSIVVLLFPDAYREEGLIQASEVIIGISVDLLIEGVFITSLLVYFKSKLSRIDEDQISSPGILSQGIDIFPKILIIKLLMDGLITAFLVVGLALLIFIMTISSYPMSPLFATFLPFISLIVSSFPLVAAGMLLVVFSYAYPSIVMEKVGPIDSLVSSWDFVKKNLWPTLVIVFLFTYVPSLALSFISPEILVLGVETILLQIFETGQLLCFLWGFETFRMMQEKSEVITKTPPILPDQRSPAYLYITQPYFYRSGDRAPLRDRLIALLIDSCIVGGLTYAICLGWLYQAGKDYIREGQSFGKGLMGLRVIDYNTGMPATVYQSFIRNCLCGCVDASCCCLAVMIDEDGRRIGDHVAGTVVIKDQ